MIEKNPDIVPVSTRPACNDCGVEMWLRKIITKPTGDTRVFECPVCDAKIEKY